VVWRIDDPQIAMAVTGLSLAGRLIGSSPKSRSRLRTPPPLVVEAGTTLFRDCLRQPVQVASLPGVRGHTRMRGPSPVPSKSPPILRTGRKESAIRSPGLAVAWFPLIRGRTKGRTGSQRTHYQGSDASPLRHPATP
jgi:hypothetical protein